MSDSQDKPNQYDGPCWRCGTKVPALTGTYSREHHRSQHAEGQCKTTTKTWQNNEQARLFQEFIAANALLYAEAGYTITPGYGFEGSDEIRGHGLTILVGGSPRNEVRPYGVRIFRGGELVAEYPRSLHKIASGEAYYEQSLARTRELIALIDKHREP